MSVHEQKRQACSRGGRGGGEGTLIFSYIRRLGSFFFWFKILNFNIFGGFQKNKYFGGYEGFIDIFLGSSQDWTIFRGYFYAFYDLFLIEFETVTLNNN